MRPLGEGLDNTAYEAEGELVLRFSKEPDAALRAEGVLREARLLDVVRKISPLPTPEPRFTAPDQGCLAYVKLPGAQLLDLFPVREASSVAATLGHFLSALHSASTTAMAKLVETDDVPLTEWLGEAQEIYGEVASRVPPSFWRPAEAFLEGAPPSRAGALVFSHNDLGIEHVLVDAESRVTGIIDWTDAAITDPATDFGRIYRDLGPAALDVALAAYGDQGTLRERAEFYARCGVFEDLAYGMETGDDRYTGKSLAAMQWLFPVSAA